MKSYTICILLVITMSFLSNCINLDPKPDCTRYYVLRAQNNHPTSFPSEGTRLKTLGVSPTILPSYLQRAGLAMRVTNNELNFSEWNRWAEPLSKGFNRVLTENLRSRLQSFSVINFTKPSPDVADYTLSTSVDDFIGDSNKKIVSLKVTWFVKELATGQTILTEESIIEVPLRGELNCAEVTEGMSTAIAQFTDIVSEKLLAIAEKEDSLEKHEQDS